MAFLQDAADVSLLEALDVAVIPVKQFCQRPILLDPVKKILEYLQHGALRVQRQGPGLAGRGAEIEGHIQVGVKILGEIDLGRAHDRIIDLSLREPEKQIIRRQVHSGPLQLWRLLPGLDQLLPKGCSACSLDDSLFKLPEISGFEVIRVIGYLRLYVLIYA